MSGRNTRVDTRTVRWRQWTADEPIAGKLTSMVMPTPPAGRCQQLVEAAWDFASANAHWPSYAELDRWVDRRHDMQIDDVLREMPPGILWGINPNNFMVPSDSQEIGLTVAGVAACPGTDKVLSLYVEFIQLAAEAEKYWEPPDGSSNTFPTVKDVDYASQSYLLPVTERDHILQLVLLIIKAEQAGWGGLWQQPDSHWGVTITREIRRFRNVADIDDYWSKRYKYWESQPPAPAQPVAPYQAEIVPSGESAARVPGDAPIFIVHGTDTVRAEEVARTVSGATGRKAIILRNEPNLGRTLIEKFEQHAAEASYAIIILTPDDKGSRASELETRPRGRQNVVFEMGYFYGQIGRANVSVLLAPGVERPSDMDGIAYITLDDDDAWKEEILRELQHVGFNVNL
jgi:Predicted nucleotide-binding protein containing TIR-like domain